MSSNNPNPMFSSLLLLCHTIPPLPPPLLPPLWEEGREPLAEIIFNRVLFLFIPHINSPMMGGCTLLL